MYAAPAAKIVDERRISGLGIAAAVAFAMAIATIFGMGFYVGFDVASWSVSTSGQRMIGAVSVGIACGSLFALVADIARHAFR
jgi:hypothetical protein